MSSIQETSQNSSNINTRTKKIWNIPASFVSQRTINPIRDVVFKMKVTPNPEKEYISLALGDPTHYGNLNVDENCIDAIITQLKSHKANGYLPAVGVESARIALAKKFSTMEAPLTPMDIVIASGASDALGLAIGALCNEGQNILLPRPGFSLYQTISESKGIECRYYNLLPDHNWEIDLDHLASLIDDNTACLLINNPSNPCGSNFTRQHLECILNLCEIYKLPVISDEIYEDIVFGDNIFYPLANLSETVPILKISGLAKRYLVPGWRVGWIFIHDRNNLLNEIRDGLASLANLILGANSLIQCALPDIIMNTSQSFYDATNMILQENAKLSASFLEKISGLHVIVPQGAMFMMVGINVGEFKDINNDVEFSEKLVQEESVLCLPGKSFHYPNYVRIVITAPAEKLREAYQRINEFCVRHHV
ncbi:14528_t:CDS:2 [Funneliformis geosporum]|uniref:Tyrosine aminotransferase n=1 Tax=Funneliformis geosporum TaxID=1117311 RepID=A0A9W4SQ90_9GLOM|nr:14528_t:CDS:2 [Funneliformis geosporum]CAI2177450.1 9372_t:CDS:2 [Funneliformis geosporum]